MSCDDRELDDLNEYTTVPKLEDKLDTNISEYSENVSVIDNLSEISFDKLNEIQNVKPDHWTDDYWETITSTYKWFVHKGGFGGCNVCFANKIFMGKRSLLACIKLRLMELSYSDFEQKLQQHISTAQHCKSVLMYNSLSRNPNGFQIPEKIVKTPIINKLNGTPRAKKKCLDTNYPCPMCTKNYKMKKVLAKHIFTCNDGNKLKNFNCPCGCEGIRLSAISALDDHIRDEHNGKFLFKCQFCNERLYANSLFGHLLQFHDYTWHPSDFMPEVLITESIVVNPLTTIARSDRKRAYSKFDDIYYRYDTETDLPLPEHPKREVYVANEVKQRKIINDEFVPNNHIAFNVNVQPVNKIERIINKDNKETSHLMLSLDQIHTCEHCGGRYLSASILQEHINTRHIYCDNNVDIDSESLLDKYKRKLVAIAESLNTPSETGSKRPYTKRKVADPAAVTSQDNTISPCLLTCPLCQSSFLTLDSRNQHVSKQHPEIEEFVCHQCGLIFTNHSSYNKHIEKSHNNNMPTKAFKTSDSATYSCTICPLVFTNMADLSHHVNLSHPDTIIALSDNDDVELMDSMDIDHVTSDSTAATVSDNNGIIEPVDNHVASDDIETPSQDPEPRNPLADLIECDHREKPTSCSKCDIMLHNAFEGLVHGLSHQETDSEISLHNCPNCNQLFFGEFGKNHLKDHYNVVHLKKPAPQCIMCDLVLPSSLALERHQVNGLCSHINDIDDPYLALMSQDRLAFSCPQCGLIIAGEYAQARLEVHNKTCSFELMDDDEFLDS